MQQSKRGNGYRHKRRRRKPTRRSVRVPSARPVRFPVPEAPPLRLSVQKVEPLVGEPPPARLMLHEADPVTGDEERLSALFYDEYRGYTIYSTQEGTCVLHGRCGGCLRIGGAYACFPEFEEAKNLIKYFRAQGIDSWEHMEREVPQEAYVCLNRDRKREANTRQFSLAAV